MDTKRADEILKKMKDNYEAIAQVFSDSRTDLWEERQYFGMYVKDGTRVLDLGCANGRLLKLFEKHKVDYTGVDNSPSMLENAKKYSEQFPNITTKFVEASMMQLPFYDNSFDQVFCIASLHHIPSHEYQHQALTEICRVLKPGGLLCMSNWDLGSQERYLKKRAKLKREQPELLDGFDQQDFIITWRWGLNNQTIYRYYYSFSKDELAKLLSAAGLDNIQQKISDGGLNLEHKRIKRNIITTAQKVA